MALTFWQEPKKQIRWQLLAFYAAFLAMGWWFSHQGNQPAMERWEIILAAWFVWQFVKLIAVLLGATFPPKTIATEAQPDRDEAPPGV